MDSQTLEQVAQRSYGVSTLRGVQIPTGHGFEKPVLLYAHINLLLQRAFHEKVDLIFVWMYSSVSHLYSKIHSSLGEINLIRESVCKMDLQTILQDKWLNTKGSKRTFKSSKNICEENDDNYFFKKIFLQAFLWSSVVQYALPKHWLIYFHGNHTNEPNVRLSIHKWESWLKSGGS